MQIPLWVKRMGGMAVVKVPYANAGQGVWTIVNDEELAAFMLIQHHYQSFIVQVRPGSRPGAAPRITPEPRPRCSQEQPGVCMGALPTLLLGERRLRRPLPMRLTLTACPATALTPPGARLYALYPAPGPQALIGNSGWSSRSSGGAQLYHVGTVPNAKGNIHAFDLRMMVGAEPAGGFFPVAIYARRARRALPETLVAGASSWDILGTNLSIKARGARAAGRQSAGCGVRLAGRGRLHAVEQSCGCSTSLHCCPAARCLSRSAPLPYFHYLT